MPFPYQKNIVGKRHGVHLTLANMFVGAKHDRSEYGIITNNLYAVMLRPLQK